MNSCIDAVAMKAQFDSDGFVVVPDFLSGEEVAAMVAVIDGHYGPIRADYGSAANAKGSAFERYATEVIPWDPVGEREPLFVQLLVNPKLDAVTAACLGDGYSGDQSLVMLSPPGGKGQAWHQDCPVAEPGYFNVNRLIYVEDVTPDNGSIVIVPKSHRMGLIPEGGPQESIPGEVSLLPKAGTLVLLNGLVYHRVTPNRSDAPRTSVNFRAYAKGVPTDVCMVGVFRNGAFDFRANAPVKS